MWQTRYLDRIPYTNFVHSTVTLRMQITWGHDFFDAKHGKSTPVQMDTHYLINGHVLILGASGVGKSHLIREMLRQASAKHKQIRFHVFDVHGDLNIPGASVVQFSEAASYGLNPLRVNPDPHFGGVRKCIQNFIRTLNDASRTALGLKQEAVLRNLLLDVFQDFGFVQNDAATWAVNLYETRLISGGADNRLYLDVPYADKNEASAFGARWDGARKLWWCPIHKYEGQLKKWPPAFKERSYPTINDVLQYARRVHEERFLGSDQKCVRALESLNKRARVVQRKLLESMNQKRVDPGALEEEQEALEAAKEAAVAAYTDYIHSVQTGVEFESLVKYDSADVLKSVIDRLGNLIATGIFNKTVPPFDSTCAVWRYKLNTLFSEEKKMLVLFLMQDIFNKAVQRGEQSDVVEVIVLDEMGVYCSASDKENGDGIIGVVAREARKFGLALWGANQSPVNVPESLSSSVAVKVILGLDESHWKPAVTNFRIETKQLEWITPWKTMAVQMKEKGALKNRWRWVALAQDKSLP